MSILIHTTLLTGYEFESQEVNWTVRRKRRRENLHSLRVRCNDKIGFTLFLLCVRSAHIDKTIKMHFGRNEISTLSTYFGGDNQSYEKDAAHFVILWCADDERIVKFTL